MKIKNKFLPGNGENLSSPAGRFYIRAKSETFFNKNACPVLGAVEKDGSHFLPKVICYCEVLQLVSQQSVVT